MKDVINMEINRTSYKKLNRIKKWFNIQNRTNLNKKSIFECVLDEYIKTKNIHYVLNDEINPQIVKAYDKLLKDYRSDINLETNLKEDIESIQEYLEEERNKKISINNIVRMAISEYIENHSEIQGVLVRTKYIKQNILMEEKTLLKVNNKNA